MTIINVNSTTRIPTAPTMQGPRPTEVQSTEERQLIARLFGKPIPEMTGSKPAAERGTSNNDEFAPHLGRNLDVLA